ncbi:hypothetical protein PM8797T_24816 [Gimesia maris DSM 8797]|nr:hypothetical protein PM8797T_24816 [Gimesia maris DSM 8797]
MLEPHPKKIKEADSLTAYEICFRQDLFPVI